MVVKAGQQAMRREQGHCGRELFAHALPLLEARGTGRRRCEDDVPRAEDLVQLDRLCHRVAGRERSECVVCRMATQPEVVQLGADLLRERKCPREIRCVEFHHAISHRGYRVQGARKVPGQFASYGIEFQPDRNVACMTHIWRTQPRRL